MSTAFVLSGGAGLGALQVGMLHALYEHEIWPDMLVGSSVGAVNAAFLASRPRSPTTTHELAVAWRGLRRGDIFPLSVGTLLGGLRRKHNHVVPDGGLRAVIRRHIPLENIEDAAIPLHVVCFDVSAGREAVLCRGPAQDVLVASCSIPGILPPVHIAGRQLADSGVFNSAPISHAVAAGAQRIYVLPTAQRPIPPGRPRRPSGAVATALTSFRSLVANRLEADVERYGRRAELTILPPANPLKIQPRNFGHAASLIESGYWASRALLAAPGPASPGREDALRVAGPRVADRG